MAEGRFSTVSEDEIAELLANREGKSTQKVVNKAKKTFEDFLVANGHESDFSHLGKIELNEHLRLFFASIRKKPVKDGAEAENYKKNAYMSLKYGLCKFIKATMKYDVAEDEAFATSMQVYEGMLKKLKETGLGSTSHYPPIKEEDMKKLYADPVVFNSQTPFGLQSKVWFEIMYYFCRRGRENMHDMTKDTFDIKTDAAGKRYVYQAKDEATKNHTAKDKPHDTHGEARMYELPGNPRCPVESFVKYTSKLHPDCNALWQRPLESFVEDEAWYCRQNVGKNPLNKFMRVLSKRAKLSQEYTNHSIRATHITALDNAGFEARDIMRTSGHMAESSIRSYSHSLSDSKKRRISETLSKNTGTAHTKIDNHHQQPQPLQNSMQQVQVLPQNDPIDMSLSDISDMELVRSVENHAVDIVPTPTGL